MSPHPDHGRRRAGEFVKVVSTLTLLGLIVAFYKDLVWLALLASVIVVLKSYVLTLLVR